MPRRLRPVLTSAGCCLLTLAAAQVALADPNKITIGVLEEVPGVYLNEPSHYAVRAVFQQTEQGWQTLPNFCDAEACLTAITSSYPKRLEWTISYQGRALGTLWARTPANFAFYAHIGQQDVEDPARVPTLGPPSVDYSGYQETPLRRPLLATAGATRLGPARTDWRARTPASADLPRVWPMFRHLAPLIDGCRLDAKGEYIPSKGRPPHRDEIELASSWVNNNGDAILRARVRPAILANCEMPDHPSEYWFFKDAKGSLRPLPGQGSDTSTEKAEIDSRARLVMPLDFVDLQGDGQDAVLFLLSGEDAGGYALYFDNFRKVERFTWLYH